MGHDCVYLAFGEGVTEHLNHFSDGNDMSTKKQKRTAAVTTDAPSNGVDECAHAIEVALDEMDSPLDDHVHEGIVRLIATYAQLYGKLQFRNKKILVIVSTVSRLCQCNSNRTIPSSYLRMERQRTASIRNISTAVSAHHHSSAKVTNIRSAVTGSVPNCSTAESRQ